MKMFSALPLGIKWAAAGLVFLLFVWPFLQPLTEKEAIEERRDTMVAYGSIVLKDAKSFVSSTVNRANEHYAQHSAEAKREVLAKAEADRKEQEGAALATIAKQNADAAERRAAVDLAILQTMQDLRAQLNGPRESAQVDVDVRVHNPTKAP
jgi:polyhydroxyalkanoate synthesis regulator phasin